MQILDTDIDGVRLVEPNLIADERGTFTRAYCDQEFAQANIADKFVQCNLATSYSAGTLRGLHYQRQPHAEAKYIRCVQGAIFDVAVDIDPDSPTYLMHVAFELNATNNLALYIPSHCAHGYQTLVENTIVYYHASEPYAPDYEAGLNYADKQLAISWPIKISEISDKDLAWPPIEGTTLP